MGGGSLCPLAYAPSTNDAAAYLGIYHSFSLTWFVITDDNRKIPAHMESWPGSMNDNRVFGSVRVNGMHRDHFSDLSYIFSDSSLEKYDCPVSSHEKPSVQLTSSANEILKAEMELSRILA